MTTELSMPATTAVLLPGTGSDDVFVTAAFAEPLAALGVRLVAPPPDPGAALVQGYLDALDSAAADAASPVLVGGVSLGAHVAAQWALRNPARCAGLLAALPAYTGAADGAVAAAAARASAALVRSQGLTRALQLATAGVPGWLAAELARAWGGHGDGLADGLDAAAGHPAPELSELRRLGVPAGVVGATDDPVHPIAVADAWAQAVPRAELARITLEQIGADRASLGRAGVLALLRAVHHR